MGVGRRVRVKHVVSLEKIVSLVEHGVHRWWRLRSVPERSFHLIPWVVVYGSHRFLWSIFLSRGAAF